MLLLQTTTRSTIEYIRHLASIRLTSRRLSLSRSGHSLSIVKDKAYVFGGLTAAGKLAGTEIHAVTLKQPETPEPDYSVIPAVPAVDSGKLPVPRTGHAACAFNICVAIFGGADESGQVLDESTLWLFNTGKYAWEVLEPANAAMVPKPRRNAHLFDRRNSLILHGGFDTGGTALKDVWHFDYVHKTWTQLPEAPVSSSSVALSDGSLYIIAGSDKVSGDLHSLKLADSGKEQPAWQHIPFPTNPLTPGPQPRAGAGLLPMSTGYGRQYLLYMFGSHADSASTEAATGDHPDPDAKPTSSSPEFWSDMWTYQLPSSSPELKANPYEALKPAAIKDTIRGALGLDSGKHSWGEVEVLPPKDMDAAEGKLHPGPRASFACDVMKDKRTVVIWGGVNPKGEREGDGWMITLE